MTQQGRRALRARRLLGLGREGDEEASAALAGKLAREQLQNGSFDGSPMKTAGVLNLLDDLKAKGSNALIERAASYLISVLESQPGCERAGSLKGGRLDSPCDLCGFFGPYEDRNEPEVLARGAGEMNFYREFEPLLGPKSPVRGVSRSTLDRPGASSCYAWGLIPLSYVVEALCRAGHADDERIRPAVNVLLGAQRESGGWCRSLTGHPSCSLHAIRAVASHAGLRRSEHAGRVLEFLRRTQTGVVGEKMAKWWRGSNLFAAVHAVAAFGHPIARCIVRDALKNIIPLQRRNGTFGGPCRIERVMAVLVAERALESDSGRPSRG
jgi:hypothetical protein